jgi:tetratricopeptide (TPR) repeat protein
MGRQGLMWKPYGIQDRGMLRQPHEAQDIGPRNIRVAAVCLFLLLAVALVFGQTVHHGFVFDDDGYISANRVVQKGLTLEGFRWALTYGEIGHGHPLTWLSHMLDVELFGLNPAGHHLMNVGLHAASAILLFLLLWRMTGFPWRSAFVAAVFAIHPLRAESVAWVAERKDVLSGLFFMLTLGAWLRYVKRPDSKGRYALVILLFALGLLSKNMLVTLPFVLLLLDYWPLNRIPDFAPKTLLGLIAEKWPLFVLTAISCVITFLVPEKVSMAERLPLMLRLENAVVSYAVYLKQMVWPSGLAAIYPNPTGHLPFVQVAGSLALLAAITWAVLAFRKKRPYLVVGWLWYLGMLVPVIGIVQISYYAHADRYTYLPQIGLYLMAAWIAAELSAGWRHRTVLLGALSAVILAGLMYAAHIQVSYWRDGETLWRHTLAHTTDNYVALDTLGVELAERGEMDAAIDQYRQALEIRPDYPEAHNNLGIALAALGQIDEAISHYRKALEQKPDSMEIHTNLGIVLEQRGQMDEAVSHYRRALEIRPDLAENHFNTGTALAKVGRMDEALAHFQKALEIKPDYAEAHNNLGNALVLIGQDDAAIAHFRKALEIRPGYAQALFNLERSLKQQTRK